MAELSGLEGRIRGDISEATAGHFYFFNFCFLFDDGTVRSKRAVGIVWPKWPRILGALADAVDLSLRP
jgi:hypothetical protein